MPLNIGGRCLAAFRYLAAIAKTLLKRKDHPPMPAPLLIHTIQQLVSHAIHAASEEDVLHFETMPETPVDRPGTSQHGEFATNLPLSLAPATRVDPLA